MSSFPIAWKDQSADGETRALTCPYDPAEILEYLNWCHHNYALSVPPGTYSGLDFVSESRRTERTLWLWEASDPTGQRWRILVGSGASPFAGEYPRPKWAWMWAQSAVQDETTVQCVSRVWRDLSEGD